LIVFYEESPDPHDDMDSRILQLRDQKKALLRKHVSNGLVVWEYQPHTGEWGPNYDLMDEDTGRQISGYKSEDFEVSISDEDDLSNITSRK
jgi:hypothetical protein